MSRLVVRIILAGCALCSAHAVTIRLQNHALLGHAAIRDVAGGSFAQPAPEAASTPNGTASSKTFKVHVLSHISRATLDNEIATATAPGWTRVASLQSKQQTDQDKFVDLDAKNVEEDAAFKSQNQVLNQVEADLAATKERDNSKIANLERAQRAVEMRLGSSEARLETEDLQMRHLIGKFGTALDTLEVKNDRVEKRATSLENKHNEHANHIASIKSDIKKLKIEDKRQKGALESANSAQAAALKKAIEDADAKNAAARKTLKATFNSFKNDTKSALSEIKLKDAEQEKKLKSLDGDIGRLEEADKALEKAGEEANALLKKEMIHSLNEKVQESADEAAEALASAINDTKQEMKMNAQEAKAEAERARQKMANKFNNSIKTAMADHDANTAEKLKTMKEDGEAAMSKLAAANDALKDEMNRTKSVLEDKISDVEKNADEKAKAGLEALKFKLESKIDVVARAGEANADAIKDLEEADAKAANKTRAMEADMREHAKAIAANKNAAAANKDSIEALEQADVEQKAKNEAFQKKAEAELRRINIENAETKEKLKSVDSDLKDLAAADDKLREEQEAAHKLAMKEIKSVKSGLQDDIKSSKKELSKALQDVETASASARKKQKKKMEAKFDKTIKEAVNASDAKAAEALQQLKEDGEAAMLAMEAKHAKLERTVERTKKNLETSIADAKAELGKDIAEAKDDVVREAGEASKAELQKLKDTVDGQITELKDADAAQAKRMREAEDTMNKNARDIAAAKADVKDLKEADKAMAEKIVANEAAVGKLKEADEEIKKKQTQMEEKFGAFKNTTKSALKAIHLKDEEQDKKLASITDDIDKLERADEEQKQAAELAAAAMAKKFKKLEAANAEFAKKMRTTADAVGKDLTKLATDTKDAAAKQKREMEAQFKKDIADAEASGDKKLADGLKAVRNEAEAQEERLSAANARLKEQMQNTTDALEGKIKTAKEGADATAKAALDAFKGEMEIKVATLKAADAAMAGLVSKNEESIDALKQADKLIEAKQKALKKQFHTFKAEAKKDLKNIHLKNQEQDHKLASITDDIDKLERADEEQKRIAELAANATAKKIKALEAADAGLADKLNATARAISDDITKLATETQDAARKQGEKMKAQFKKDIAAAEARGDKKRAKGLNDIRQEAEAQALRVEAANAKLQKQMYATEDALMEKIKAAEKGASAKAQAALESFKGRMENNIVQLEEADAAMTDRVEDTIDKVAALEETDKKIKANQDEALKKLSAFRNATKSSLDEIEMKNAAMRGKLGGLATEFDALRLADELQANATASANALLQGEIDGLNIVDQGLKNATAEAELRVSISVLAVSNQTKMEAARAAKAANASLRAAIETARINGEKHLALKLQDVKQHAQVERAKIQRANGALVRKIGTITDDLNKTIASAKSKANEVAAGQLETLRQQMLTQIVPLKVKVGIAGTRFGDYDSCSKCDDESSESCNSRGFWGTKDMTCKAYKAACQARVDNDGCGCGACPGSGAVNDDGKGRCEHYSITRKGWPTWAAGIHSLDICKTDGKTAISTNVHDGNIDSNTAHYKDENSQGYCICTNSAPRTYGTCGTCSSTPQLFLQLGATTTTKTTSSWPWSRSLRFITDYFHGIWQPDDQKDAGGYLRRQPR